MINTETSFYYPGTNRWLHTTIDLNENFYNCADIFLLIFNQFSTKDQCPLRLVSRAWAAIMPVSSLLSAEAAPTPFNFVNLFFKTIGLSLRLNTDQSPAFTSIRDFYASMHVAQISLEQARIALDNMPEEVQQARFLLKIIIPSLVPNELEIFKKATKEKKYFH